MTVAAKPLVKVLKKPEPTLAKAWSLKEGLKSLRRNLSTSASQDGCDDNGVNSSGLRLLFRERTFSQCDVWRALSPAELPEAAIVDLVPSQQLSVEVFASGTGPKTGFLVVDKWLKGAHFEKSIQESWKSMKNRKAHGATVSLYEKNPFTGRLSGEPVADAFIFRARRDSAFLAVADGVNWGYEAMQAARCAIFAVYECLETRLYGRNFSDLSITNTKDAAQLLFETFSDAQDRIVACTTGLTTLCVGLVLPTIQSLSDFSSSFVRHSGSVSTTPELPSKQFALIVASVGDSQAFLLSKFHGIREITGWVPVVMNGRSRNQFCSEESTEQLDCFPQSTVTANFTPTRDFRDAGGALGSVYSNGNPELNNLICAVTLCDPGDLVILASDGLTDNFDPVITRIAVPESPQIDFVDEQEQSEFGNMSSSSEDAAEHAPVPARSWTKSLNLSPPSKISIWPRPPPPPFSDETTSPSTKRSHSGSCRSAGESKWDVGSCDQLSARTLNFTNQLELNWYERRRYAGKEIERVWHETDASSLNASAGVSGTSSSRDLCDALVSQVLRVTSSKRDLLQHPDLARLRIHPGKLKHLNITVPQDELGTRQEKAQRKWLSDTLKCMPGKLDHATVVVYEVGHYNGDENETYEESSY